MVICTCCGYDGPAIEQHHVYGRKNSNITIDLCANCHAERHGRIFIIENTESSLALAEIDKLESGGKLLNYAQQKVIFDKYHYKPYFDGEYEWLIANGYIEGIQNEE
jgi:hypothetical protein